MLEPVDDWRSENGKFEKDEFFYKIYDMFDREGDAWAQKKLEDLTNSKPLWIWPARMTTRH